MNKIFADIDITTVIGFIAGVLTAISMLPQVIKTMKEKEAEDVSLVMLIVLLTGISLWIYYGIARGDWPIIITNAVSLSINIWMTILRVKYRKK